MTSKTHPDSPLSDGDARIGRYVIHALRFEQALTAREIYDRIRNRWQDMDGTMRRLTFEDFERVLKRTSGYVYSRNKEGKYAIAEQMKGAMAIRGL